MTSYTCYMCGEDFESNPNWTHEDAMQEGKEAGVIIEGTDVVRICDECYPLALEIAHESKRMMGLI